MASLPFDRLPLDRRDRARWLGNWVNLSTPLGLLVARAGRATVHPGPRGLVLAEGYRLPFPIASAFTVGNVLITSGRWEPLLVERPTLLSHEEQHSWQWLVCLGLPFLPAYAVAMGWSMLRTGDGAAANVFERHAGLARGGYREVPVRPLAPVVRAAFGTLRSRSLRSRS